VEYQAAQDVAPVRGTIPEPLECLIGSVTVKYLPANPGNSIIVSEEWSGFRSRSTRILSKGA
jgi:hypothetical protein